MIVSLPIDTTSFKCSEPGDSRTLDDLISEYGPDHWLTKGMLLSDTAGENVYEYALEKGKHVTPFQGLDPKAHKVGDIVIKNGHHHIIDDVNPKAGTKTAYQPEEYTDTETDLSKFNSWKGRYFKTKALNPSARHWTFGDRTYYLYWTGDEKAKGHNWRIRDNTSQKPSQAKSVDQCGNLVYSNTGGCDENTYIHVQPNYAKVFTPAKDIRAVLKKWGSPCGTKKNTLFIKSMVERGEWLYFRTWCNVPVKYHTVTTAYIYHTTRIFSPEEIEGFEYYGKTNCYAAFDDKNYTKGRFAPVSGAVTLSMVSVGYFNTIALGRIQGDRVDVAVVDEKGSKIFQLKDYPIRNNIADSGIWEDANAVLYTTHMVSPGATIQVKIYGGNISIGRCMVGNMLRLGFSNTLFDNGFKDYSPKEQDQWGNIEYRNGIRVYLYSGTVDLPLKQYDALNRAFMYVGGREMIINGSDTVNNTPPDSIEIFQSTMMIGRFTAFKQRTKNAGGIMDTVAGFNFSIEESV